MRVSEGIAKARHELAEPTESEWTDEELASYLNDGFAVAWRAIAEQESPIIERIDSLTFAAGIGTALLESVPLRVLGVWNSDNRDIPYRTPEDLFRSGDANPMTMWTVSGLRSLLVRGIPAAETTVSARWIPEPPALLWDPVTSQDDEIPLPAVACDLIVQFVLMKAYNRLGGRPQLESTFLQQYRRDVVRALEIREPPLLTCAGYWNPIRRNAGGW